MRVQEFVASAAELHAIAMPVEGDGVHDAELWVMRPTGPALVMGSSQKAMQFDRDRLDCDGVELAERRSGGGAVFIDPAATVWIDLLAPRSSQWWSTELSENFLIVGRVWQRALASLGVHAELCIQAPTRTDASALACWAGLGWGELTVGGAKVVGLSQRRTRWGARVQAMAVLDGSSARVGDYFSAGSDRDTVRAAGLPTGGVVADPQTLESILLAEFGAS